MNKISIMTRIRIMLQAMFETTGQKIEVKAPAPPDPRLRQNWKDLRRRDWLPVHWEQYLGESERMIPLAKQNPHAFNVEEYEKLHVRRQREHFDFLRGKNL